MGWEREPAPNIQFKCSTAYHWSMSLLITRLEEYAFVNYLERHLRFPYQSKIYAISLLLILTHKKGREFKFSTFFTWGFWIIGDREIGYFTTLLAIALTQSYSAPWGSNSRFWPCTTLIIPSSPTSTTAVSPSLMRPERISSAKLSSNNRMIARRRGLAP